MVIETTIPRSLPADQVANDVISFISQKGGAGKTTLALNLAGAANIDGLQSVVIDLDPQASAEGWHDQRNEAPVVISTHATRLAEVIDTVREHDVDLCIIDTAPHSETVALAAAKAADLILIPCRPAVFDLRAISSPIDLTQIAGKPALVVDYMCIGGTSWSVGPSP